VDNFPTYGHPGNQNWANLKKKFKTPPVLLKKMLKKLGAQIKIPPIRGP